MIIEAKCGLGGVPAVRTVKVDTGRFSSPGEINVGVSTTPATTVGPCSGCQGNSQVDVQVVRRPGDQVPSIGKCDLLTR